MNKILQNTHKSFNVSLMRIRDYYFIKAKRIDWWLTRVSFVPIVLTVIILSLGIDNDVVDIILGAIAIALWIAEIFIKQIIEQNVKSSNRFREYYDILVLEQLKRNDFSEYLFPEELCKISDFERKMTFSDKYEIWYEEIFSEPRTDEDRVVSELANTICCQADNLIYGAHVYEKTAEYHKRNGIIFISVVVIFSVLFLLHGGNMTKVILILVSVFGSISLIYDNWDVAKNAGIDNRRLIDLIKSDSIKQRVFEGDASVLCELQSKVENSRARAVFVPNAIRNRYLELGQNPFYAELDHIKNFYYKDLDKRKPSCADDIETFDEDGNISGTVSDLQRYLFSMLLDVVKFGKNMVSIMCLTEEHCSGRSEKRGNLFSGMMMLISQFLMKNLTEQKDW